MKIVFATNNQHKLQEIRDILGSEFEIVSLKDIGCDVDIPETGNTLEENAMQKAQYVYDHYNLSCFADDMQKVPTMIAKPIWQSYFATSKAKTTVRLVSAQLLR